MSFCKSRYDDNAYKTQLNESIGPGNYMLERLAPCDNTCSFYSGGGIQLSRHGDALCDKELIDVDSELIGITRHLSQCPSDKYLPKKEPFCKVNFSDLKECDFLTSEPTLISNPKCTNKETTINRWEWLCLDPQKNALMPFDWNIDNRQVTKMNHRPLIERPIDQSSALPPPCNNKVKYDWASRYSQSPYSMPSLQLASCANIPLL
jgi:hypothetical protein